MLNNYGYPTTRCHPRSTNEAFPQDQADWWFPPEKTRTDRVWLVCSLIFFLTTILYVLSLK